MKQVTYQALHISRFAVFLSLFLTITSCQFLGFGGSNSGCGQPTLQVGEAKYEIKTINPKPDGSVKAPTNKPDTVYMMKGKDTTYIFFLSPGRESHSLFSTLNEGTAAKVTWSNCNTVSFTLNARQSGSFDSAHLPDPSQSAIAIYIQGASPENSFVITGELTGEEIYTFDTPSSSGKELQAEISLLGTTASPDGNTIQLEVSIYNFGNKPITLTTNDVSLSHQGVSSSAMINSDPSLPREIAAAATETFTFTFPRPTMPVVILKVFTAEYEVDGY